MQFSVAEAKRRRVHNLKLILPSTQESDSSRKTYSTKRGNQTTYKATSLGKRASFFAFELAPAFLLLAIPLAVHAGFFSKMAGMFAEEVIAQENVEALNYTPLNTPLLSANKNPDPQKAVGGAEDISYDDGVLVSTGPVGEDEISAAKGGNGEISVYVVRERDTLSDIADMYGVTVNTIMWANDIAKTTDIHEGDSLVILPIVGVRHTVIKGETLGSIVKKYGANLEEVLDYNNMATADELVVGDILIVPGGELHTAKAVASAKPTKTSGTTSGGGGFTHPVPGAIRTQGIHGYNGVDLAAGYGTAIHAAAAGTVLVSKNAGWNGGYGNYIVVKHGNGTQTLYAHLSSNGVGVGDWVEQGDVIGAMGNSGKSTGTHLHFEVRGGTNPF